MILNLNYIPAPEDLLSLGVVDLEMEDQLLVKRIFSVDNKFNSEVVNGKALILCDIVDDFYDRTPGKVLISGAPVWLIPVLDKMLKEKHHQPIYAVYTDILTQKGRKTEHITILEHLYES